MDRDLLTQLETFLRPLYQDLDGASRFDEVERIASIARRLHEPAPDAERQFALLLLFHRLGKWLEKVGNLSRVVLTVRDITEADLRATAASIRRLDDPRTPEERVVAAATMIDAAGIRGLTDRLMRARREGSSIMDVIRAAMGDVAVPDWLPPTAEAWLQSRREARREMCRRLLEEIELEDFRAR